MKYHFVLKSANSKTGPLPVTYSQRETCPESCPHYRADCYAEDYYTRMSWDRVAQRGGTLAQLCESVAALPAGQLWRFNVAGDLPGAGEHVDAAALGEIVRANTGRRIACTVNLHRAHGYAGKDRDTRRPDNHCLPSSNPRGYNLRHLWALRSS